MIPALNATVSALHAFEQKLGVTAGNIANVNTDGYKKYRAISQEGQYGTVEVTARRDETGIPLGRLEEGEQLRADGLERGPGGGIPRADHQRLRLQGQFENPEGPG